MLTRGTYDFVATFVPLPIALVEALLPPSLNLKLDLESLAYDESGGTFDVVLELGRQIGTGPAGLPGMTFQEAKLEIPSVISPAHPSLRLLYKHTVLFSNRLIQLAASHLEGINSHTVSFNPSDSPAQSRDGVEQLSYEAVGFVKSDFVKDPKGLDGRRWSESSMKEVLDRPYCSLKASKLSKLTFDFEAPIYPFTPYRGAVNIKIASFLPKGSQVPDEIHLADGWFVVKDAEAVRAKTRVEIAPWKAEPKT